MGITNFGLLSSEQKTVWSREVWSMARDMMFVNKFLGKGSNSLIQRITELTKTEKGERALMFLVADLVTDGTIGDNQRTGNEEALQEYEETITIDLIANQVVNKGKLADQKHVIRFREQGRDKLAYWIANRVDQLAFLTMSGIAYSQKNNGAARTSSAFANLAFAADVSAPTTNRHRNWTGTALVAGNTATVAATYLPNYDMIIDACGYAKENYIKPLRQNGREYYVILCRPGTLNHLKKSEDFQRAITSAAPRGKDNPWFTGASVTIDGAVIHEHNLVYTTLGLASGSKWGSGSTVDGTRTLLCGAQALGMADLGPPEWEEEGRDFKTKQAISVDKMFGLVKPKFHSIHHDSVEDFGVLAIDHAV